MARGRAAARWLAGSSPSLAAVIGFGCAVVLAVVVRGTTVGGASDSAAAVHAPSTGAVPRAEPGDESAPDPGAAPTRRATAELAAVPAAPWSPASARAEPAAALDHREASAEPAATLDHRDATAELGGRALDPDGRPLAGVLVDVLASASIAKGDRTLVSVESGEDGAFLARVPLRADPQGCVLMLSREDRVALRRADVELAAGARVDVGDLVLHPASLDVAGSYTLAVTVVDEGRRPLADVPLELERRVRDGRGEWGTRSEVRARTDAQGRALLSGELLGEKRLAVDGRGLGRRSLRTSVAVHLPGHRELEVVLDRGATLAGRAFRADDGAPVELLLALWEPGGSRPELHARSGPDGAFRFTGLEPARGYELGHGSDRWSAFRLGVQAGARGIELALKRSDDPSDRGLHGIELHGRVVDASSGAPAELVEGAVELERIEAFDAATFASDAQPNLLFHPSRQTFLAGPPERSSEFRFAPSAPGVYLVRAVARGRAPAVSAPVEVARGQLVAGLELRLETGRSLAGTVRGPSGEPLDDAYVLVTGSGPASRARVEQRAEQVRQHGRAGFLGARGAVDTDGAGRFRTRRLPSELPVRLVALHREHAPVWSAVLVPARAGEVELRFRE